MYTILGRPGIDSQRWGCQSAPSAAPAITHYIHPVYLVPSQFPIHLLTRPYLLSRWDRTGSGLARWCDQSYLGVHAGAHTVFLISFHPLAEWITQSLGSALNMSELYHCSIYFSHKYIDSYFCFPHDSVNKKNQCTTGWKMRGSVRARNSLMFSTHTDWQLQVRGSHL